MSDGPFREPGGCDTQPFVVQPFGYARWQCPYCREFYLSTQSHRMVLVSMDDDETLVVQHVGSRFSGCNGVWRTRTWEQERQLAADRRRTLAAAEKAREPEPSSAPQWTWGSLYAAVMLTVWASLGPELWLRGVVGIMAFCAWGAWWSNRR